MAKHKTTTRILLSCTCMPLRKPTIRYGSTLQGLTRAAQGWMDRGGHGNPNHTPTIRVEVLRFQRAAKEEATLRRALSAQAERRIA